MTQCEKKKVLSNEKIVKDFTEMIDYFPRGQTTPFYREEYDLILQGVHHSLQLNIMDYQQKVWLSRNIRITKQDKSLPAF